MREEGRTEMEDDESNMGGKNEDGRWEKVERGELGSKMGEYIPASPQTLVRDAEHWHIRRSR